MSFFVYLVFGKCVVFYIDKQCVRVAVVTEIKHTVVFIVLKLFAGKYILYGVFKQRIRNRQLLQPRTSFQCIGRDFRNSVGNNKFLNEIAVGKCSI